ncbi:MAG: alkaline phosphatase family protein [Bacteroidota bacterium]
MKSIWACTIFLMLFPADYEHKTKTVLVNEKQPQTRNLFIITTDGFRWQEVFNGADSSLLHDDAATRGADILQAMYWASTPDERRKKLLPFFWNIIGKKGQLYGNRLYGNKVNTANAYAKSYPVYNEIFTGNTDPFISSNRKLANPHINVLEYLNSLPQFRSKVVAFSSWDVFPFILNEGRSAIPVNSGYEDAAASSAEQHFINAVQEKAVYEKTATRMDELTFLTAKEYIREHHPKILYLSLGETDEFAHQGRYDLYLQQAHKADGMIAELWHLVQTTPGYKDNTTFIITTDHGRGNRPGKWASHGSFIHGSSQVWLAIIGPGIAPLGEIKEDRQLYLRQLAATIAGLMGGEFCNNDVAALSFR